MICQFTVKFVVCIFWFLDVFQNLMCRCHFELLRNLVGKISRSEGSR